MSTGDTGDTGDSCASTRLQEREPEEENWSAAVLSALHLPNPMQQDVPRTPGDYLTQPFKRNHLDRCALRALGAL